MAKLSANDPWALFRYKAFISYAHADAEFVEWLETRLGAFDIPRELHGQWTPIGPVPTNLRPVFRDQTNLSAGHNLSEELKARLAESATLIVVCSPAAAASKWVAAEIEHFRAIGRGDRIFSIIIDGVPRGGEANCFPEPFMQQEPIAANARAPEDGGEGRESALIKLIAGMLRVDPTELQDKENALLAARARNARRLAMIFAGVAAVAVLSAGFAISETLRANRSIAVAQQTIDGVIQTLESDQMQQVWGFENIEADLLERLTGVQDQLGGGDRRSVTVQATLLMRQAGVEGTRGNIEESIDLNKRAYDAIVPRALRSNATQEQRTLALRAVYRYFRALGSLSRSDEQERILTESEPILRATLAAGNLDEETRRWSALWLDNRRQFLGSRNEYAAALRASDEAIDIVEITDFSAAPLEARIDYALTLGNRVYTLRGLNRDAEASQVQDRYCGHVSDMLAEAPMHRNLRRLEIACVFDRAQARFNRRDRTGAISEIQQAITLAAPAARGNAGDTSFEAAIATAYYRIGEVERWIDNNPHAALVSYQRSMHAWGEIYRESNRQLSNFDNLEASFNAYTGALDALEQADSSLKARHAEMILSNYGAFQRCGERLGGASACGRVTMAAARAAGDRLFSLSRGGEVVEPMRLAERLSRQVEGLEWYQRYSDTYATSCAFRRDVGRALVAAGRSDEAIGPLRDAIEQCGGFVANHDYDIFLRSALWGQHQWLARAERATGDAAAARRTLAACYALYGANCYEDYAQMLEQGIGGAVDLATARQVRAQRAYTNMKRFTAPVRAPGSEVTFPFHFYVFERPPNFPYQGVDDQIRWLEVNRGLEVAPEIGESFRRLEQIARENNVSFPDLAVYALQAAEQPAPRNR